MNNRFVLLKHGLRLVVEGLDALDDGVLIVVHAATRLATLKKPGLHRIV